jgi:hypothetical protein
LILGIISITNNSENYFNYGYLIASLLYFAIYFFKSKYQYLTIGDGAIVFNSIIPQKISFEDLNQIKKKGKIYIILAGKSELHINTTLIEKNSLKDLNVILKKLKDEI